VPAVAGTGPSLWTYNSTDPAADVDGAGYFTNAKKLGMKVGDIVFVTDTDASPPITTSHRVYAIDSTTGAADLSDTGATIGSTAGD